MGSVDGEAETAGQGKIAAAVTGGITVAVAGILTGRAGGAVVICSDQGAGGFSRVMPPASFGRMGFPAQSGHAGGDDDCQEKECDELVQERMRHGLNGPFAESYGRIP